MTATASYRLGIDLGTTYTAAAVARDERVEVVGLGNRATAIPSVIHVAADGATLIGEAADRRGPVEPDRVAREFKRRIGDPTPVLIGGTPHSAEALTAMVLRWVVDKVTELEGGPPAAVALTHPANWGPYKQDLLAQAARLAEVSITTTMSEPEAAAIAYAANERVESGSLIAVYDLGGGTFDAAVLRKSADGFEILGQPEGIERLGGIDFDEAVIGHVRDALADALDAVDLDDPATLAALTRLRRDCIDAKEALSSDTDVSIPVLLPGIQTDVRLTRAELEQMLRPTLLSTVDAMRRALASAEVEPTDVGAVLLAGGSSRIPLVAELLSDAFGRPIAVDAHPKHVIAQGAAIALGAGGRGDRGAATPLTAAAATAALAPGGGDDGELPAPTRIAVPSGWESATGDDRWAPPATTGGDRPEPTWTLPVQRGGTRSRRLVGAVVAAIILVGVLVAGAAARSGAVREREIEPSTGPTIEAVEVAPDGTTPRGSGGGAGDQRSSGGGAANPQRPAGEQAETGADAPPETHVEPPLTEEPPPTESEPPSTGDGAPLETRGATEAPAGQGTTTDPDPTTEQDPTAEGDTTAERDAATEHDLTAEGDTTATADAAGTGDAVAGGGDGRSGADPQPAR